MLILDRRGRISLDDADKQLAEINREEAAIQAELAGVAAQEDLTTAFEH